MKKTGYFFISLLLCSSLSLADNNQDHADEGIYSLLDGSCNKSKEVANFFRKEAKDIDQDLTHKIAMFLSQCTVMSRVTTGTESAGLLESGEGELWSIQKALNTFRYYIDIQKKNISDSDSIQEIDQAERILGHLTYQMRMKVFSNGELDICSDKAPSISGANNEERTCQRISKWDILRMGEEE